MAGSFITKKVLPSSGEVRYIATITHNSRNHKTKRFKRKTDASIWAARYLSDIENFAASGKKPCSITFERLADDYLKSWSGTDAVREYAVEYFKAYFGSKLLDSITSDDCKKALQKWEQKNLQHLINTKLFWLRCLTLLSAKTMNRAKHTLRIILPKKCKTNRLIISG